MVNLLYNLAQPFSNTKQYTQGVIVIYNDRMYEMTADEYTPGPFDPEKFTERFLSEMISGKLNSNLGSLISTKYEKLKQFDISINWSKNKNVFLLLQNTSNVTGGGDYTELWNLQNDGTCTVITSAWSVNIYPNFANIQINSSGVHIEVTTSNPLNLYCIAIQ